MSLDDAIARLARVSLAFKDFTTREKPPASRLAQLVLNLPVREFLREADETERGLYTITRAPNPGSKESIGSVAGPSMHGVQPKTVETATPLKPQTSGRVGRIPGKVQKKGKGRVMDDARDPEVALRAALKLVDIYHGMPRCREHILERIEAEHRRKETISNLQKELDELNLPMNEPSDTPVLADLEREIRDLEQKNEELRRMRDNLVQQEAERKLARNVSPVNTPMANRRPTAAPGSTRKSIFGHSYLSTPGWSPVLTRGVSHEDESNLLETPDISQLMAQTPLGGVKTLKSGSGWDDSIDETVEPQTPPQKVFSYDEDVDQEEYDQEDDAGSFAEEDTVLRGPPRGGLGDEDEYGEEDVTMEGEGIMLPKALDFTAVRKGADSPDEDEDDRPPPKFATSTAPLHSVSKSPGASVGIVPVPKVDIPLERFVIKLWNIAGDTLVPGHNYNVGKGSGTGVPPSASETMELLSDIAGSFSISSPPSDDTKTRILTARMLHYLLVEKKSNDPPYSAGQSELRQVLAEKAIECSWPEEDGLAKKVYFTWVGKKLVRPMKGRTVECCFD